MRRRLRALSVIPKFTVIAGLILYACSLALPAIRVSDMGEERNLSSIVMVIMGSMSIFGGALAEWVIWLANPLFLISMVFLLSGNKWAIPTSFAALLLAVSFAIRDELMAGENGRIVEVVALADGYWLWLSSLFVTAAGSAWHFSKKSILLN